jgi:hypothetical protein
MEKTESNWLPQFSQEALSHRKKLGAFPCYLTYLGLYVEENRRR